MRRWYAAFGVAIICLLLTVGASSTDSGATVAHPGAPKLLAAPATALQPTAVVAPSSPLPAPAFVGYAIVALETTIATALLCYAFLQRRRAARVPVAHRVVRLRGPPV